MARACFFDVSIYFSRNLYRSQQIMQNSRSGKTENNAKMYPEEQKHRRKLFLQTMQMTPEVENQELCDEEQVQKQIIHDIIYYSDDDII